MTRAYRVAFASVELVGVGLFGSTPFVEALEASWEPGGEVTRHRRKWRVSVPHRDSIRSGVWTGHIGFVRENELATLEFDEEEKDFVRGSVSGGVVIPFAVDLARRRVAFQLVPGQVRTTSFTGAFESILNSGGHPYRWKVRPLVSHATFDEWREGVERITEFQFTLRKPNPHYHDDRMVEQLIEEVDAEVIRVAGQGDNLDEQAPLFQQALDHVLRRYGKAVVRGEGDGHESEWRSAEGGTVPVARRVESEDEQEVPEQELVPLLDDVGDAFAESDDDADEDDFATP